MKIVLLSLKGLGDTLIQIPLIRAIKAARPDAQMTILVPDRSCAELFSACPYMRPVVVPFRKPGLKLAVDIFKLLLFLRSEKFDIALTTFPSNRVWYNLLAFWTGAPKRITHSYGYAAARTFSFLQNCRVPAGRAKHSVEHNLDLLGPLGMARPERPDMTPWLSPEDEGYADNFLKENGLGAGARIAGIQAAINPDRMYKAWGPENMAVFAALMDWLKETAGVTPLLFAGPDEEKSAALILGMSKYRHLAAPRAGVNKIGALMKRCELFINTDSGLGHLAAAVGTPTVTAFGPSNPALSAPYGGKGIVINPGLACAPCYSYPYSSVRPQAGCAKRECLRLIDLEKIKDAAAGQLGLPLP